MFAFQKSHVPVPLHSCRLLTNPVLKVLKTGLELRYAKVKIRPELLKVGLTRPRANFKTLPEGGRLKYFLENWEKITLDPAILQSVKGLKIN